MALRFGILLAYAFDPALLACLAVGKLEGGNRKKGEIGRAFEVSV